MGVSTSDGATLGRVVKVWCGTDPNDSTEECDEDVCSRLEVRVASRGVLSGFRRTNPVDLGVLYIPCRVVAGVSDRTVTLTVTSEAVNASDWSREPRWIWQARGQTSSESHEANTDVGNWMGGDDSSAGF